MLGYIVLIPVIIILIIIPKKRSDYDLKNFLKTGKISKTNFYLFLVFLIILVWSSIRGNISIDIEKTYFSNYNIITYYGRSDHYGYLFNILNVLVINIFHNFQAFLFITAFIYISCVFYASKKLSEWPAYSAFLFIVFNFLYGGLNQIRQYIGVAFFCLALCCLTKDKYIKALILIIIAGLNHSACYLLLIALPLSKIKISRKTYRNILLVSPLSLIFAEPVVDFVLANYDSGHYDMYIEGGNYGFLGKFLIPFITCWGLGILYFILYDEIEKEKNSNLYVNLLLCSCIVSLYGTLSSETVRIVKMIFFCQIFFIPSIFKYLKIRKIARVIWRGYITFNFAYFIFYTYTHASLYPYEILTYL